MANPVKLARERIAALRAQVAELERFIAVHEVLTSDTSEQATFDRLSMIVSTSVPLGNKTYAYNSPHPVDNPRREGAKKMRPDHMAELVARIIREVGRPMTRGQIVEALEARDVPIPYDDKHRYVGTIVWRSKRLFVSVSKRGYWLKDLPVPPETAVEASVGDPSQQADLLN
jgi:hypothetical protein